MENISGYNNSNKDQVVVFKLGNLEYSLPISNVREIINTPKITKVPMAERRLEGVFNSRGTVIPVINLEYMLSNNGERNNPYERVIILETKYSWFGVLVDAVTEVFNLDEAADKEPMEGMLHRVNAFVDNVIKAKDGRLILSLDVENLFRSNLQYEL